MNSIWNVHQNLNGVESERSWFGMKMDLNEVWIKFSRNEIDLK